MRNAETLAIVDQFVDIRRKLRIAGMAVLGLHENNDDGVAIACRIFNLADELWTVIERVYPDEDGRGARGGRYGRSAQASTPGRRRLSIS